jgi:hypothetical protein
VRDMTSRKIAMSIVPMVALIAFAATPAFAANQPNILFIMDDDIGIMNVGAYHQGHLVSPARRAQGP